MPQLNPAPWFMIFMFTWAIFLTILPPKVMAHTFPNEPSPQGMTTPKTAPWNWPWH
ncbi:ATP synthase F0 subunit 8 (mitochondrion) [Gadus morhua]|uniref:ATP synthase F(0) complex subunit 8 n=13 Tax=Gadidae TaxID=8045 RepID=ATP8_GADMO|nr:ATP synthase F0 subunit 8 [Gadus morhua]NP_758797.1 ATP synthase F0 subunit 8 [Gadus chalcogrammus]YP_001600209.1 ATP synthase F0 subunit 8 [Boreogadus saida]YP_001600222.1 ATP synthase F0 subunit 8 [Arctogadus glacialis]YP_009458842.1 ATP synthase F0 subunit 8 [Gadus macrocephalus]YP_313646.1 ATP synthase F0 subunit 8 [Merlangius merlangus]YP_313659.1 ATP synthase F0 subunit 8 [Melanogrammus aeglefinus]P15996.1 RecName: Full=ATP synthase protein 8; AltName: Full=A6L; AltName: Full=F-ATPa